MKLEAFAKKLAADCGAVMKKALGDFRKEFEKLLADHETAVENRFAALPEPQPGAKGDKGDDATLDMDVVKQILLDAVAALELPKGEKGDAAEVDMEAVKLLIIEEVRKIELPIPEKGDKGDPGVVDMDAVKEIILEAVKTITVTEVKNIVLPEPKSAVDIEIEDGIDETKAYPRNSYARHKGGLWRSFERTKGMKGWECIVAGVNNISVEYDGERTVSVTVEQSDGEPVAKEFALPVMIDRGVWREGDYLKGDTVTFSGAIWVAQKDTPTGRPGISADWRLACKRGGTGKSAYDLAREAGFEGTRQEWLDGLGKKPTVKIEP